MAAALGSLRDNWILLMGKGERSEKIQSFFKESQKSVAHRWRAVYKYYSYIIRGGISGVMCHTTEDMPL